MAAWAGALGGALAEVQKLRQEVEQGVDEALGIRGKERAGLPPPLEGGEGSGRAAGASSGAGIEGGGGERGEGGGETDRASVGGGRGEGAAGDPPGEAPTWGQVMKLQRRNEELMRALAAAGAGDTGEIVAEANARVGKAEERAARLAKELKSTKHLLGGREASGELLREKDRMIEQLMQEGKGLAARQGELEGVVKKLRAQLRAAKKQGGKGLDEGGVGGSAGPAGPAAVPPAAQQRIDELKAKTYNLNERLLAADETIRGLRSAVARLEQEKENVASSLRGDARVALQRLEDADEQKASLSEQIQQAAAPYAAQVEALQSALREERASRTVRAKREAGERARLEQELRQAGEEVREKEKLVQSLVEQQRTLKAEGKHLQDALEAHQRKISAPGAHPGGAAPPAQHDAPHAASASAGVDVVDRTELDRRKWKLEEKLLRSELEDALAVPRQLKAEVERLDRARQDDARRSEDAALCHRHELEAAQLEVRRVRAEYDGALETLGEQEERMDDLRSQVQALQGLYREHVDQKYQA